MGCKLKPYSNQEVDMSYYEIFEGHEDLDDVIDELFRQAKAEAE